MLFAVQPLVQDEFHLSNAQIGYLTSAFLLFYMVAAPFVGPLADRYSRKLIIVLAARFLEWPHSAHRRHPHLHRVADSAHAGGHWRGNIRHHRSHVCCRSFSRRKARTHSRRVLSGDPGGLRRGISAGRKSRPHYGWRFPFYIAAAPGFLLALAVMFLKEPERGQFDRSKETPERATILGLARNPAFLTATLGMAAMTFSLGGIQVWMPKFLYSDRALHAGIGQLHVRHHHCRRWNCRVHWPAAGWATICCQRMKSSYYFVSAASMLLGVPVMIVALFVERAADDSRDCAWPHSFCCSIRRR